MGIFSRLLSDMRRDFTETPTETRDRFPAMSWQTYQELLTFNGNQYLSIPFRPAGARVLIEGCGPAYAVLDRRASILGEARPMFQRLERGKPTDLFATADLAILERPWPGGTWRQLTAIAEADVAAAGNSYWVRQDDELVRLEADWVAIIAEEVMFGGIAVGTRLAGYAVQPPGAQTVILEPSEVCHYRPSPSQSAPWRGESWLAAVAADATADVEMTRYKGNYLKNGAMPSLAVLYEPTIDQTQLEEFVPRFAEKFTGSLNAGKVMHFLGGRDVKTVGATLDQLAFKAVQGAGETRIAAAAGVPAVVAGFSEGMQGSSLNAGNYVATRRLFADAKMRPLLGSFVEAFAHAVRIARRPLSEVTGVRLWYDESGVSFFQEDVADEAQIRSTNAQTIRTLIDAGYDPDAVVVAVTTGNYEALVGTHSGLFSVQLQPPGTEPPGTEPPAIEAPAEEVPNDDTED